MKGARIGRILRASVTQADSAELSRLIAGADLSGLVEAARYHRVVGYVHRALKDVEGVDATTTARLERWNRQALAAHLQVLALLRRVREALEPLGESWLVVKGPVVAALAYRDPGLRLYQDLDLVVPRARFADAIAQLEDSGFTLVDRNWDLLRRLMIGELVVAALPGPEVDVHWDVRYDRDLRRSVSISTEALVERSRPVVVSGIPVRTFDAADTLIFLALHGSKQGGDKLIWLKDIDRSIANDTPDWDDVVERSKDGGVELFVGAMIARARRVVSADVPDAVLAALLPRAWRATLAAIDRAFPVERSGGFGSPATLVIRSTRGTVPATIATAASGLGHRARRLFLGGALRRDVAQDDPDDPASRAFQTGPPGSRERYFEEILQEP